MLRHPPLPWIVFLFVMGFACIGYGVRGGQETFSSRHLHRVTNPVAAETDAAHSISEYATLSAP